jgi:sugar O-acyltransferase (sialic acid O-acetyltransferase NeuD family)
MRLFIYCSGGIGRETYDIAKIADRDFSIWSEMCFIDDEPKAGKVYGARQLNYEQFKASCSPTECRVVIAHGEPRIRLKLADKIRGDGFRLTSIIDPTARVSPTARLGKGVIAYPYAYVSSDAVIGENVLISIGSAVGHDTSIGNNTVVSTLVSISGNCSIGAGCYIGTKACIKEKVRIGENTIIGMGSCVFRDIGPGMIAVGNPARESRLNLDQRVFRSGK